MEGRMQKTTTFLMFVGDKAGKAEEAIKFYTSLFKNSHIDQIKIREADKHGEKKGTVYLATFTIAGQQYMAMDSSIGHKFNFTPAMSIFVKCESENELDELYQKMSEGGQVLMELSNYGFSKKFGWVNDRFGVSWQLNLPE
jgi:predicted 3-demethylubiquinone-9 3-methyltransferase (glyoxalase superfamily)